MNTRTKGWIVAVLLLSIGARVAAEPEAGKAAGKTGVAGDWQGALKVGAVELRLILKVKESDKGELSATMDSVDQGATDMAVDTVTLKDDTLRAELKAIGGAFEGKLDLEKQTLDGKWTQGGASLPLTLKRTTELFKLNRPQVPTKPYPYREEEVVIENKKADIKLAGTLTLPDAKGPFAAVVLITGSGPQDRDEALMGHRPFLILADHLTRRGIAVLRCDDRGVGKSTGDPATGTSMDFKDDALAAVAFLKAHREIDAKKIGLCGHSEGGMIAPMAAVESADVAFIVLMAGTGVTGKEILFQQGELILRAMGLGEDAIARQRKMQTELFRILESETDSEALQTKLKEALERLLTDEEKKALEGNESLLDAQSKAIHSPWFRFFLSYDPRPTLASVKCPVLAINGEKDVQVDPSQNLPEIEKALAAAGNRDVTIRRLPGLNHLFQTCTTGGIGEYGRIEETFAPAALEEISNWILAHTKDK